MGKIDRSRWRRGCAGALRHNTCSASLDKAPHINGLALAPFHHRRLPPFRFTGHWSIFSRHYSLAPHYLLLATLSSAAPSPLFALACRHDRVARIVATVVGNRTIRRESASFTTLRLGRR